MSRIESEPEGGPNPRQGGGGVWLQCCWPPLGCLRWSFGPMTPFLPPAPGHVWCWVEELHCLSQECFLPQFLLRASKQTFKVCSHKTQLNSSFSLSNTWLQQCGLVITIRLVKTQGWTTWALRSNTLRSLMKKINEACTVLGYNALFLPAFTRM